MNRGISRKFDFTYDTIREKIIVSKDKEFIGNITKNMYNILSLINGKSANESVEVLKFGNLENYMNLSNHHDSNVFT